MTIRELHADEALRRHEFPVVTRKIFETLDYAMAGDMDGGRIVLISGDSRRGKSHAVRQWARLNNHGRSLYIDCPESGGMRALLREVAQVVGVNQNRNTSDLRERVIKSFNRRRILIVDEILRVLPRHSDTRPVQLEFIRRLHDVTKCAIALVATPVFRHEMEHGYMRAYLEQLLGRIADPLEIPGNVFAAEARDICRAFAGSAPGEELVKLAQRIANEPGKLGVLFELLRQASIGAKKRGENLSAAHLSAAYKRRKDRIQWPEEK